jgi:ribonuclease Z
MRPSFHPRLVNPVFEDPVLFVPFIFAGRAVIFDLGDIHALPARDALKISHAFITHTHMDHFCGFDRLLRLFLGREKELHVFGPAGFLKNVAGKLAGYLWNLVENYEARFILHVTEVHPRYTLSQRYSCRRRFEATTARIKHVFDGVLHREKDFSVSAVLLDHGTPCLGFALKEPFHVNIIKDAVHALGLEVGPWVGDFKRALFAGDDPRGLFRLEKGRSGEGRKSFRLGDLAQKIARITEGQKVAYIMDTAFTPQNVTRMVRLCRGADHLFIEAAFIDEDREVAAAKHHLTARQAGTIAALAQVARLTVCHFSPRYEGREHLLEEEAAAAFAARH